MNKLISLSSEGKFSMIDSVVKKVCKIPEQENKSSNLEQSNSCWENFTFKEIVPPIKKDKNSQQFDIVDEEDEYALIEEQGLEELKKAEEAEEVKKEAIDDY